MPDNTTNNTNSVGDCTDCPIKTDRDPSISENQPLGTEWKNTTTGELFVCTDNTENKNVWVGQLGTVVEPTTTNKVDIFGDNSCVALYQLDGDFSDTGGLYNANNKGNPTFVDGKFNKAAYIADNNKRTFDVTNLPDVKSLSIWLYKDSSKSATDGNNYVLDTRGNYGGSSFFIFSTNGSFRYSLSYTHLTKRVANGDTSNTDPSSAPTDKWVHFYIEFEKAINGIIFGSSYVNSSSYLFGGMLDQIRLFNRSLTDDEIVQLYKEH